MEWSQLMIQKHALEAQNKFPEKNDIRGIKGYPTSDWNADHTEGCRKMDKEYQVC